MKSRGEFRICQFSIRGNHIHLICEARDSRQLEPETWLLRVGWRRSSRGLLSITDVPAAGRR